MNKNIKKEIINKKNKGKKINIILIVVILITLSILLGGTYAIFARIDEANIANNYQTGNLNIIIDDTSEGLGGNLNLPTIPLSDEEGSTLAPYKFKVINKGNLWYEYDLKLLTDMLTLENDGCVNNQIPSNYIKVKINDEQPQLLNELNNSIIIKEEVLLPGKENYYELRIWLDESAPNSVIGSHFHGKVITEGYAIQPFEIVTNFEYIKNYQEYAVPFNGIYQIELWGATGYGTTNTGGYTKGNIVLKKGEKLYIYVGQKGEYTLGGFNGGGVGRNVSTSGYRYGGGSTDIRYFGGYEPTEDELKWNSTLGLRSRIIVAAASGGYGGGVMGQAGGLSGYAAYDTSNSSYIENKANGGSQTAGGTVKNWTSSNAGTNGSFGTGGNGGGGSTSTSGGYGGGSGYYGGAGASATYNGSWPGGGGSSFISGHTGCVAITSSESTTARTGTDGASCTTGTADNLCSIHYSGKYFTNTLMIDGKGFTWTNVKASATGTNLMPNPLGDYYASGKGHTGNGYARITFVG